MSVVVGIDLSSRALDLVSLNESDDRAEHHRISLERDKRAKAWARILLVPELMPPASWWDEVYLVAVEIPFGAGSGAVASINRVVGAVLATLPPHLREPFRCWDVRPDEWKGWLGLHGKPTSADLAALGLELRGDYPESQDARDAACLAYYARELNARAVSAA